MNIALIAILILSILTIVINGSSYVMSVPVDVAEKAKNRIFVSGKVLLLTIIALVIYNVFYK